MCGTVTMCLCFFVHVYVDLDEAPALLLMPKVHITPRLHSYQISVKMLVYLFLETLKWHLSMSPSTQTWQRRCGLGQLCSPMPSGGESAVVGRSQLPPYC